MPLLVFLPVWTEAATNHPLLKKAVGCQSVPGTWVVRSYEQVPRLSASYSPRAGRRLIKLVESSLVHATAPGGA